jgi:hypothetical protein
MASILSKQLTQSVPSTSSSSSFCGFTMLCQWETCGLTSAGPLAHSLPKTQDTGWMTVYLLCSVWSGDCKSVQRLLTICRMNEWKRNGRSIVLAHNLSSTNCHSFIHSFMMHSIRMEKMQWSTWNLLKCVRFFWVFGYLKKNSFKRLWEIIMGTDDEMNLFLVLRLKSCLKQVQTSRTCWRGGGGMGRRGWLGEVIWVQTWHNVQRAENSVFPCRNSR